MSSYRDSRDNIVGKDAPTAGVVVVGAHLCNRCPTTTTTRQQSAKTENGQNCPEYSDWPPEWARLPNVDEIDRIDNGEVRQRELFHEPVDDSRAGRLARILKGVPGVRTADTMEATR
jgi:hypothetical protein